MRTETTRMGLVKAHWVNGVEAKEFISENPDATYVIQFTEDHPHYHSLFAGLLTDSGHFLLGFIQPSDTFISITRW